MVKRESFDLNDVVPKGQRNDYDWALRRRDTTADRVTVHFGDLLPALLDFIRGSESVAGCVAWVTSDPVIDALAQRPVALILNKEWILRSGDTSALAVRQRARLARLTGGILASAFPAPLCDIAPPRTKLEAVRCAGHSPRVHSRNSPLMHHKFIVRLSAGKPVAVWTGSFNFTANASSSLENAVEIHDPAVAAAYLAEFARVASISEPMEFFAGKSDPSWNRKTPAPRKPAAKKATTTTRKPAAKKAAPARKTTAKKATTTTRKPAVKKAAPARKPKG